MHHLSADRTRAFRSMIPGVTLLGVWLAGLSLGLWAERFCGDLMGSLVFQAGSADLSFPDACMVTMLPLLLSAFAVFFFHRFGAYLACFVRGLTIGFFLGVLTGAGGAWLAVLLLFSGLGMSPVLLWYLWRRLSLGLRGMAPDAFRCVLAGLLLAAVDTWVVAPFLAAALAF
ncbi:MAG: hypothetical protein E7451_05590 [Ruminococcaceae bacterium]|nr:hypothetical protein [Oscillospiraceae bacterium]